MANIMRLLGRRDDHGASAVEYGLLVAGIAAMIMVVLFALGGAIKTSFSTTCGKVSDASATTTATC